MALWKRDKQDELDALDEIKEPFSWQLFWEDHIVGRYKKIKEFLRQNGILYFFLSPFQYKNRLLLKIMLLTAGILFGVVPRSMMLINAAKERNAASELAQVSEAGVMDAGITVRPLMSGQYDDTHLLVFNIEGDTNNGISSRRDDYHVWLRPLRGVSDGGNVRYRYGIVPVDRNNRLLLVWADNRKQNDTTGIFGLTVRPKGSVSTRPSEMEIVLSTGQDETDVYPKGRIDLSALSKQLTDRLGDDTIQQAKDELNEAIKVYQVNEDRLTESRMELGMTTVDIKAYVQQQLILASINDDSTTADIEGVTPKEVNLLPLVSSITYNGKTYSDDTVQSTEDDDETESENMPDTIQRNELPNAARLAQNIQQAVGKLNNARTVKYRALLNLKDTLNQTIRIDDLSSPQKLVDKIPEE